MRPVSCEGQTGGCGGLLIAGSVHQMAPAFSPAPRLILKYHLNQVSVTSWVPSPPSHGMNEILISYTLATRTDHQCPGRIVGIIGQDPSVSKSHR